MIRLNDVFPEKHVGLNQTRGKAIRNSEKEVKNETGIKEIKPFSTRILVNSRFLIVL